MVSHPLCIVSGAWENNSDPCSLPGTCEHFPRLRLGKYLELL